MWRRMVVLTIGVIMITVASVISVQAQSPVPPNLDAYCQSLGYLGVKQDPTQPNNPYGKGCVRADGTMVGIDMQAACRWQFGDVYPIAQYPDPMKPDWLCYPNNNTAPKPPPPGTPIPPTAVPPQEQPQQPLGPSCGNGVCEASETCSSCSSDCGTCPVVVPPPPPQEQPSEESWCTGTFGLHAGVVAQVTPGLSNRLRSGPGLGYGVLGKIPPGDPFSITSGPTCSDGYTWWQINYQGTVGWTAEGSGREMWIERVGESGSYSGTLTAISAWYKAWMAREHIACAVFAVPNDVFNSNPRYTSWFEASDGTQIAAGFYAAGSGLESQFHVSTSSNAMLYGVCISGKYFLANPWAGPWYGSEFTDPNHWHLTIN